MTQQYDDPIIELYRASFPDFARMIKGMGGTLEEAKDSFHDALLIYLEKANAGKLQIHSSPRAYLLGTAKICWLHTRKKAAMISLPPGFEAETPEDPAPEEREKILLDSLAKSGKKCLELLKAFYYDHSAMDHIARRFGFKGRRSATVQKYKCLEKVRNEIKKTDIYAQ